MDANRPSPVRSRPIAATPQARYEHGALTAAELAGLIFWGAIWALDCIFTVQMVGRFGAAWYTGIIIHIIFSVVQQHLWRARRWGAWSLVFAAGLLNVFSSTWGVQSFLVARGAPSGFGNWGASAIYTILAGVIALVPERLGTGHLFAVWRLLRR